MTTDRPVASSGRPGSRPGGRTARTTDAVLRAAIDLFAEGGWMAVRTEAVADRAGVHRTTVHRRWPTRGALIAAALAARPYRPAEALTPATGSVRGDLGVLAAGMQQLQQDARTQAVLRRMSEAMFDPEVARAVHGFWRSSIQRAADVLREGVARGELPARADVDLAATMFVGAAKLHVIDAALPVTPGWSDALVHATIAVARASQ